MGTIMANALKTDVLIIDGGVARAAIARELSQYQVGTVLIEKEPDVSTGVSKIVHGNVNTAAAMAYSLILKSIMVPNAPLYGPKAIISGC